MVLQTPAYCILMSTSVFVLADFCPETSAEPSQMLQGGALAVLGGTIWYIFSKAFPAHIKALQGEREAFIKARIDEREAFFKAQSDEQKAHEEAQRETRSVFKESLYKLTNSIDVMAKAMQDDRRRS